MQAVTMLVELLIFAGGPDGKMRCELFRTLGSAVRLVTCLLWFSLLVPTPNPIRTRGNVPSPRGPRRAQMAHRAAIPTSQADGAVGHHRHAKVATRAQRIAAIQMRHAWRKRRRAVFGWGARGVAPPTAARPRTVSVHDAWLQLMCKQIQKSRLLCS